MSDPAAGDLPGYLHNALLAYDESSAIRPATDALPQQDKKRLQRDLECLDLLRRVWPEPSSEQKEPEPPPRELGDFRIVREIGRGGMGVVYEAEQLSLGRHVALKVLPYAAMLEEKAVTRFKNEARAAATLDHPNIVPVHAVGSDRGMHFYAMGLIEGVTLAGVIAAQNKPHRAATTAEGAPVASEAETVADAALSTYVEQSEEDRFRQIARLGVEAARALHHAHERGVVHRDIKPSNLLLDEQGKLWVADFGLARVENEATLTLSGGLVGTLRYMAPEQVAIDSVGFDHRVDVYALGLTIYELLTGEPAFDSANRAGLLHKIEHEDPPPLRRIVPHAPRDLETILSKAIEKTPDDRYATAERLANDLQRFLEHRVIEARPPTRWSRVVKWSRRHVAALLLTLAALSMLSVAAVATATLILDANREKDIAILSAESSLAIANEQRARAETKAAEAEAVTEFVSTILSAPTPRKRQGEDLTLEKVLDRAAGDLADRFFDQPLVEATVRSMLGQSFEGIGKPKRAREQFERCLELRREHLGPDAEKTRWAESGLHRIDEIMGNYELLLPTYRDAVERLSPANPDDPKPVIDALHRLAVALAASGQRPEALERFDQALEITIEHLGRDSERALNIQTDRATAMAPSSLEKAEASKAAFERYRDVKGADHINTLVAQHNHAVSLTAAGRVAEAIAVYEELAPRNERVYGSDHYATQRTQGNLAECYLKQGRISEAEAIATRTLPVLVKTLGESHPLACTARSVLAGSAFRKGDYDSAIARYGRLREVLAESSSADRRRVRTDSQYALALVMAGRTKEGLELSQSAVEEASELYGPKDGDYLSNVARHASCLFAASRKGEAVSLLREALQDSKDCPASAVESRNLVIKALEVIEDAASQDG